MRDNNVGTFAKFDMIVAKTTKMASSVAASYPKHTGIGFVVITNTLFVFNDILIYLIISDWRGIQSID